MSRIPSGWERLERKSRRLAFRLLNYELPKQEIDLLNLVEDTAAALVDGADLLRAFFGSKPRGRPVKWDRDRMVADARAAWRRPQRPSGRELAMRLRSRFPSRYGTTGLQALSRQLSAGMIDKIMG